MTADRALLVSGGADRIGVAVAPMEHLLFKHGLLAYLAAIGVSSGALCVQKFAMSDVHGLRQLVETVDSRGWFMNPTPLKALNGPGLHVLKPLEKRGRKEFQRERFLIPVGVGVHDLEAGIYRNVWCDEINDTDEWTNAWLASCAQHFLMHGYDVRVGGKAGEVHRCQDGGGKSLLGVPLIGTPGDWKPDPRVPAYKAIDAIFLSPIFRRQQSEPVPHEDVDSGMEALLRFIDDALDEKALMNLAWLQSEAARGIEVNVFSPENAGGSGPSFPGKNKKENLKRQQWRLNTVGPWLVENVRRL